MFKLFIKFLIFFSVVVYANDFNVDNLAHKDIEDSNFPYFSSKKYPKSAVDINTIVQYKYFKNLFSKKDFFDKKKNPFYLGREVGGMDYTIKYKVQEFKNYISLRTDYQICAPEADSCTEPRKDYFIFDKYTGRLLGLDDLFTKEGLKKLRAKIIKANLKKVISYKKKYIGAKPSSGKFEYLEMYTNCEKKIKKDTKLNDEAAFGILEGKMVFEHERCTPEADEIRMPTIEDEIGKFSNTFSFSELSEYFTDSAKEYLSSSKYILPEIKGASKFYRGKLAGKYPITFIYLVHHHYYSNNWGYWYDKYKKPIELRQVSSKEGIKLIEEHYSFTKKKMYKATIVLNKDKDTLKGTYTRHRDSKVMSIVLK